MPDNFEDKHYSDYFKKLENNISSDVKRKTKSKSGVKPSRKYRVIRIRPAFLISVVAVITVVVIVACIARKAAPETPEIQTPVAEETTSEKKTVKLPVYAEYTDETAEITDESDSKNIIVINTTDNIVVAARDAETPVSPASTTKVMTILTAVENCDDLNSTFTMSYEVTDPLYLSEATLAGFSDGESVTVKDLLYGAILPSGADATVGLAIKIAGSEENFVKLMNKKVKELNLKNTHFSNTSGLYSEENYTSAHDMAVILQAAISNEVCKEVLSTYKYTTASTPQHPEGIELSSTLFSYMYGTEPETATIIGGKTGYINESGYCIATFGENNTTKNEYVAVTFGGSSLWPAFYGQIELYKEYAK